MNKIKVVDLFCGCGGFIEGFEQSGLYSTEIAMDWDDNCLTTLANRLDTKWGVKDTEKRVRKVDLRDTDKVFSLLEENGLSKGESIVVGGPPCQAYSVAGRIRDKNGMKNDYRNYLYREYSKIVDYLRPPVFIFENVMGLLSAKPEGKPIVDEIRKDFEKAGYVIPTNLKNCVIDTSDFGVPQVRKRIIILGLRKDLVPSNMTSEEALDSFYNNFLFTKKNSKKKAIRDAIGHLPKLLPLKEVIRKDGRKFSHDPNSAINGHQPRFHNERDIGIFREIINDIDSGIRKYSDKEELKKLYAVRTGKTSSVHKYHVLEWDNPSTTIVAHLYKDGLRHIHPDAEQSRSITVREAALIQTFPEDFEFVCSMGENYKMIGNAVPPKFARELAICVKDYLTDIIGL